MEGLSKKSIILGSVVLLIFTSFTPSIYAIVVKSQNVQYNNFSTDEVYEYVIITTENFENSNFQILVAHKSQYLNATVVTKEDILSNPDFWVNGKYGDATSKSNGNPWVEDGKEVTTNFDTFNDEQAKIRNFIRFAYLEWQTRYVLLGGDVETIPVRQLRVDDALWFNGNVYLTIDGNIRADLYYAALNGTYNDDFDEFFGEDQLNSIREEADFIADVYVGRAPVDDKKDIKIFVDKVIHYETHDKPNDIQLHQCAMNSFNNPDSIVVPETCAQWIPESFNIHKLYQTYETVTKQKWIDAFRNPNKLIILQVGGGSETYYYLHHELGFEVRFTVYDVNQLDNTFYPIHISIACNGGDFGWPEDCIAEQLLLWQYGGPSACIFNSHFGFVTHESALDYSGEFIERQFYEIFENETENLGKVVEFSKQHFTTLAYTDPGYRWCTYTVNLLGDPETPVFGKRNKLPIYDEVFVDDDFDNSTPGWGVDHFDNIQDGINAVFENGFVYVYNGTYQENIEIDKTLNLVGENKNTTIIEGDNTGSTITINASSSIVNGFTIKHIDTLPSQNALNGITVPPNCEGNEIFDNIITENEDYGIFVERACSANIHDNYISSNGIGVGLVNYIEESAKINGNIIASDICDNIISDNTITLSGSVGVYIAFANNNHVRNNIFVDNCIEEDIPGINPNAFFINAVGLHNEWDGNYWDEPRRLPQLIHGRRGDMSIFTNDIGTDVDIGRPSVEFDWNPVSKTRSRNIQNYIFLRFFQIFEVILSKIINNFDF